MKDQIRKCLKFIDYLWYRWCLATEMYMVEKWERVTINVIFLIVFTLFGFFNYKVVLSLVSVLVSGVMSNDVQGDGEAAETCPSSVG